MFMYLTLLALPPGEALVPAQAGHGTGRAQDAVVGAGREARALPVQITARVPIPRLRCRA
jgi:hypothetical protein